MSDPDAMLRQIWSNHFSTFAYERCFVIDHSVPEAIVDSLHPMPAEMTAVLDYWRNKMVAAIDEVVLSCKVPPAR